MITQKQTPSQPKCSHAVCWRARCAGVVCRKPHGWGNFIYFFFSPDVGHIAVQRSSEVDTSFNGQYEGRFQDRNHEVNDSFWEIWQYYGKIRKRLGVYVQAVFFLRSGVWRKDERKICWWKRNNEFFAWKTRSFCVLPLVLVQQLGDFAVIISDWERGGISEGWWVLRRSSYRSGVVSPLCCIHNRTIAVIE